MAAKKKTLLNNNYQFMLLGFFVVLAIFTYLQDRERDDPSRFFEGYQGTFVLMELPNGPVERYHPALAAKRLPPQSTFKIPNALIGLDTGVVSGPDHLLTWDGTVHRFPAHNQNHTLQTAIEHSVVWYFQALAAAVGPERMAGYLKSFDYGNQDISGGITTFWLHSSLAISADEQVEFLRKLYGDALPAKPHNMALVREMLILERTKHYLFSGKTGSDFRDGKAVLGWFVGHLALEGGKSYVFACNIQAGDQASGAKAKEIAIKVLRAKRLM